jgi:hypothetical protein
MSPNTYPSSETINRPLELTDLPDMPAEALAQHGLERTSIGSETVSYDVNSMPDLEGMPGVIGVIEAGGMSVKICAVRDLQSGRVESLMLSRGDEVAGDAAENANNRRLDRVRMGGNTLELGREDAEDPSRSQRLGLHRTTVSRKHFSIALTADGKLQLRDMESTNGTNLVRGQERLAADVTIPRRIIGRAILGRRNFAERSIGGPNYENARDMQPDELWAQKNNGGRAQDPDYIRNYRQVRDGVVDAFESGKLYRSPKAFMNFLKGAHRFLGEAGDYNRLNKRQLEAEDYGQFEQRSGRLSNGRLPQAMKIAELAERYGDNYGGAGRFQWGKPNSESYSVVELPGIDRDNLPYDVVRYDERGWLKSMDHKDYRENGYEYVYPGSRGVEQYLTKVQEVGKQIEATIKAGNADHDRVLEMIALQYQYGANARPFHQINNSLFMQLANAQVKMLGLKGMTHGDMDIAAQRMQPRSFARYFVARAKGLEE